jgi:hypothetical protein
VELVYWGAPLAIPDAAHYCDWIHACLGQVVEHPLAGATTQRKAHPFELATQQWRTSLIDRSDGWQAFSKRPAVTGGVATVNSPGGDP